MLLSGALYAKQRCEMSSRAVAAAVALAQQRAALVQPCAVLGHGCDEFLTSAYPEAPSTPPPTGPLSASTPPGRESVAPAASALWSARRLGLPPRVSLPDRYTNITPDDCVTMLPDEDAMAESPTLVLSCVDVLAEAGGSVDVFKRTAAATAEALRRDASLCAMKEDAMEEEEAQKTSRKRKTTRSLPFCANLQALLLSTVASALAPAASTPLAWEQPRLALVAA